MRKEFFVLGLTGMVLLLSVSSVDACGDKLLVLGRGARFRVSFAEYPASILYYMDPAKSAGVSDSKLQSYLRQAGHKFQSVRSVEELGEALKSGRYDIALIDFADAPVLEDMIQVATSRPLVLPIVETGKKADVSAAQQRYGRVLKAPFQVGYLLTTIDRAMEFKQKHSQATVGN